MDNILAAHLHADWSNHSVVAFRNLSSSRRAALARQARIYCNKNPHMASACTFWRNLSATQVRELAYQIAKGADR
jgi:hypothetical protein